jgi:hypothetical protein
MRTGAMNNVYLLQHSHEFDDGSESVKVLGIYSTRKEAKAAIIRFLRLPGFCDAPKGFSVDKFELNKDEWVEGYFTEGIDEK